MIFLYDSNLKSIMWKISQTKDIVLKIRSYARNTMNEL